MIPQCIHILYTINLFRSFLAVTVVMALGRRFHLKFGILVKFGVGALRIGSIK